MADKVKTSSELKLDYAFFDGDNRIVIIDNPRDDITVRELLEIGNIAKTTGALIGDKAGTACVGLRGAKTVNKTVTELDLR